MNPAEVLRAAADRIDQLAAAAAPAPWKVVEFYTECWGVDSAKWNVARENEHSDLDEGDARWIAALGPQIAPHLYAVFQAAARDAEKAGADPRVFALARSVLGETGDQP